MVERKLADGKLSKRIINIKRNGYRQEQYGRRECIEIVGLPENLSQEALDEKVVDVFQHACEDVNKRDFHTIHPLKNKSVVIAKCVNRRDAIAILRAKRSLRVNLY